MNNEFSLRDVFTAIAGALGEWLFVLLPLVVVATVTLNFGTFYSVLEAPEWAFGASVLAGQALVRLFAGVAGAGELLVPRVVLFAAGVFVIILVPAIVVLVLGLRSELSDDHLSGGSVALQVALFCVSSVVFILVGTFGHLWTQRNQP